MEKQLFVRPRNSVLACNWHEFEWHLHYTGRFSL